MGVDGQRHAPAALPPGKTRYPLYRRLGGPQSPSGQMRKISPHTAIRSRTVQPVAQSLYQLSYPDCRHLVNTPNTKRTQCSAKARERMLAREFLFFLVTESQNVFHPLREVTCCQMEVLRSILLHVFFNSC